MNQTITFYFDFSSSYSYIAEARISEIEEKTGLKVDYRPILLGAVFQHLGHAVPAESSPKMDYFLMDLQRTSKSMGIPFRMPPVFPFNAIKSMRLFYQLEAQDPFVARDFASRVFSAAFGDGKDMGQSENIAELLNKIGFDMENLLASESFEKAKSALKQHTGEAIEQGVFGAPSLVWNQQLFWGADRIDTLIQSIQEAS